MRRLFTYLASFNAAAFALGAAAHLGRPIPLGFATIHEPRIVPATIVEALCAASFAIAAYGLVTGKQAARGALVAAHAVSIIGVLVGMASIAVGAGPRTLTNDVYHRVMLGVLLLGVALLIWSRLSGPQGSQTSR